MKKVKWLNRNKPEQFKGKCIKEIGKYLSIYYKIDNFISSNRISVTFYGDNEKFLTNPIKEKNYYRFPDREYCEANNIKIGILDEKELFLEML